VQPQRERPGALATVGAMAVFFIDTRSGHVATQRQLVEAAVAAPDGTVPRPWLRIQGTGDATTMWFAILRREERGIFIGTMVLRHSPHHSLLVDRGWEEIPVAEISATARVG
jgi:hypothetical protein